MSSMHGNSILRFVLIGLVPFALAQACSVDTSLFGGAPTEDDGSGGDGGDAPTTSSSSGMGGNPTTTSSSSGMGGDPNTSSSSGVGEGPNTSSSSGVGGDPNTSSSSGQGGSPTCGHDICDLGGALQNDCDPCVTQICQGDPFCCDNQWDQLCLEQVFSVCNIDCNPNAPDCANQYNGFPGYYFCSQTGDLCTMGANLQGTSCNQICSAGGGECEGGFNNQGQCGLGQNIGCNGTGLMSAICVCSRGCGNGPACSGGQICINGQCQ